MLRREILGEADHRQQRRGRPVGIVLAGDRSAPERHHRIADEFVDRPAMFEDDVAHPVEIGVEQGRDPFRRQAVAELGEAFDVGEQRIERARFAGQGKLLGIAHICAAISRGRYLPKADWA